MDDPQQASRPVYAQLSTRNIFHMATILCYKTIEITIKEIFRKHLQRYSSLWTLPAPKIFILGTYKELVDSEVIGKQKELLVDTVRGVPGANIEYMVIDSTSHRAGSRQMFGVGLWGLNYTTLIINHLFTYLP